MVSGSVRRHPGVDVCAYRVCIDLGEDSRGETAEPVGGERSLEDGKRGNPGSVTSSGRFMPSAAHASGSSWIRPGPKRMAVG